MLSPASESITKDDRYRFRLLAQHWDDVADVMIAAAIAATARSTS
jgi:hypothetical protein